MIFEILLDVKKVIVKSSMEQKQRNSKYTKKNPETFTFYLIEKVYAQVIIENSLFDLRTVFFQ